MGNAGLLALPRETVNVILETAELTDLRRNVAVLGVNAIRGVPTIANGEEPKTIITIMVLHPIPTITITIIMVHHLTTTIIIMVHLLTTTITITTTVEAPRAEVPRAEVPRAGRVAKIIAAEKSDRTRRTKCKRISCKWLCMALWAF